MQAGGEWVILLGRHLTGWLLELAFAHEMGHFLRGPGLAEYQRRHADSLALFRLARLNEAREEADAHSFAAAWVARQERSFAEQLYHLQRTALCVPVAPEPEGRVYGSRPLEVGRLALPPSAWSLARTVW